MDYNEPFHYTYTVKGKPTEIEFKKIFRNYLVEKYGGTLDDYIFVENNDIKGDWYVTFRKHLDSNGIPITRLFEVKNDMYGGTKSDNIYIEYMSREKKSGILASKSDFYAIRLFSQGERDVFYIIKKVRLFQACDDKRYDRDGVPGGDDNKNLGLLFKWKVIEEITKEGIEAADGSMILECNTGVNI